MARHFTRLTNHPPIISLLTLSSTLCVGACLTAGCGSESPSNDSLNVDEPDAPPLEASQFPNAIAGEERVSAVGELSLPSRVARKLAQPKDRPLVADGKLGTVFGVSSDGTGKVSRYTWVVDSGARVSDEPAAAKLDGQPVPPAKRARISPSLARSLATTGSQLPLSKETVPVVVTLRQKLETELSETDLSAFASFDAPVLTREGRKARIARRVERRLEEAGRLQSNVRGWLEEHGVPTAHLGAIWSSNAMALTVPASLVAALSEHPDVESVERGHDTTPTGATTWDGANLKSSSGLNANKFINNLNLGDRVNPKHGYPISIGVLDAYFADDHPVFQHSPGVSKIVGRFTCINDQPCVAGGRVPPDDDQHGSWCASAAAGAARNGQIGGTAASKLDRTGVAEQTELTFIDNGGIGNTIRALEQSVSWANDIVSESFGGGDGVCDGTNAGWPEAVYAAHQAGVLVVGSAGNGNHDAGCTLTGLAEAPSQFVVGATDDPGSGSYANVGVANYSSRGGINVTVGNLSIPGALSGVSALVPGAWQFGAGKNGSFVAQGGTSLAAPQVAGIAALFKDWMIGMGFSNQANTPGTLFTNLLAMTDRVSSSGTKLQSGFDPVTGGGRLQARLFDLADHPSGLWRWETANYTLSHAQRVQHLVGGAGAEPNGINTFKVYAAFFEADGTDIADIDVRVKDKGCGANSLLLGQDVSRDTKSMVQIGSSGSGKDICVQLDAFYVPPGQTREVTLVTYYTGETSMR